MKIALVPSPILLLYAAAGFGLLLLLVNRSLSFLRDGRVKSALIPVGFIVMVGGSILLGLVLPRWPWVLAPTAAIILILAGEVRRAYIRRQCRGSAPLESNPPMMGLPPITTRNMVVHRYCISLHRWPGRPFRIVHLSDLHVPGDAAIPYYQRALDIVTQARPDLVFVTGDFITTLDAIPALKQVLRPMGKWGTFAVLGNHDYWAGADQVALAVKEAGLVLLDNESMQIHVDGHDILLTGYDYPWGTERTHIPSAPQGTVHLVLSHTPDNIYRIAASHADGVFSGHYHAGQIRVPLLGPLIIPSVYGRRFDHGHFCVAGTHLFVASGVGAGNIPMRIYCRPDIFIVDVVGASQSRDVGIDCGLRGGSCGA